jgi:hypothetical protein
MKPRRLTGGLMLTAWMLVMPSLMAQLASVNCAGVGLE